MIRNFFFKITLFISIGFSMVNANAQQANTLYFMENMPVRNYFNPAFQAYSDFYLGLPVLGFTHLQVNNNSFTLKDMVYKQGGKSIFFLNKNGDKSSFYNILKPTTLLQSNINLNLFDFGFRRGNSYWTFSLTERVEGQACIPKDLAKLILFGTPDYDHNTFDLTKLSAGLTAYTEGALGYSRIINEKWSVGAKLKFLSGSFNASYSNADLSLAANMDQWNLKGNSLLNYSCPIGVTINDNRIDSIDFNMSIPLVDWINPSGLGAGMDLGFTYKPVGELTLSAALLDLGMIRWQNNVTNISNSIDYTFNGFGGFNLDTHIDTELLIDSVFEDLKNSSVVTQTFKGYTTYTSPKLNVGAEYAFFKNRLSLGLLSRTFKQNKTYYEELTASVNGRPVNWFNMSASYSLLNGRMSNIGAALGLRTGFLNWFVSTDYVPFDYAHVSVAPGNFKVPLAYKTKGLNIAFGVNLVLGNSKDSDRDGVVDRKDKCPETPFSVVVDKNGCPLDADGDGVPDYMDKCPKTPKEAYSHIDQNGCPVDNDGDGVPDYLDKCPNTPSEAIAYVDSVGCVADSDHDGVSDYQDKCPDTPARVRVDSVGCPLDTDGDGIPDYLDKCPDTPVQERSRVDANGCTEPAKSVTEVTGKNDAGVHGVAGSQDKSQDVSAVARDNVDRNANAKVSKEVQNLFRKGLQGIQFATGKYTILPVSYRILNQIAGVMIANPTYVIEIRGHTDNIGNPEKNMALSGNRAKAVMNYLIEKGVAADRMRAEGFGDTLPVVSNKTAKGRAANRRVEFVVVYHEITFE